MLGSASSNMLPVATTEDIVKLAQRGRVLANETYGSASGVGPA